MATRLTDLLGPHIGTQVLGIQVLADRDAAGCLITGLSADSRTVEPGFLFAALPAATASLIGTPTSTNDGARFIADALAKGASCLLVGPDAVLPDPCPVPVLRASNPRRALALIAARHYGPGPDTIVAVTGTSGKTSVAEFTRQIFALLGHKAASLGTIGVIKPAGATYGSLTTPDPITLARTLAELRAEGITHLAMEASSHGLDQHRLDGVTLTAGAFTNLGRDHMDYHPTVEHYLEAKLRLFRELLPKGARAVVNADGAYADQAIAAATAHNLQVLTVGIQSDMVHLAEVTRVGFHQRLTVVVGGASHEIDLPLVGAYQVENALTAAGLVMATGAAPGETLATLTQLKGVPGRLDIVGEANGGLAIVDYAHKPEALTAALAAVRPFASGKLICVFGCGGDRDKGKRPIMGQIAADKSDLVIITDDNPRSENPAAIRAEILAASKGAREIPNRAEAIHAAIAMMGPGDVVIVCGKGHETGQIVGNTVLPFSDHAVLAEALVKAHST